MNVSCLLYSVRQELFIFGLYASLNYSSWLVRYRIVYPGEFLALAIIF
jgi:hypothetical protein